MPQYYAQHWILATAQTVTTDGTTGTIVSGTDAFVITGGTQQLETLFHSFEDFSPSIAYVSMDSVIVVTRFRS